MKPPAPPEVCAVKMALRSASAAAREARKEWTRSRAAWTQQFGDLDRYSIGALTCHMWLAEQVLAEAAAEWREVLAAREAMLVAERWNLAELEKWAQAQPC